MLQTNVACPSNASICYQLQCFGVELKINPEFFFKEFANYSTEFLYQGEILTQTRTNKATRALAGPGNEASSATQHQQSST